MRFRSHKIERRIFQDPPFLLYKPKEERNLLECVIGESREQKLTAKTGERKNKSPAKRLGFLILIQGIDSAKSVS